MVFMSINMNSAKKLSQNKKTWKMVKLGDVAGVQNGYAFKSGDFSHSGVPILKIKNIASGKITLNNLSYYPHDTSKLKQFVVKYGDVLVSMTGSHISQLSSAVGKTARYSLEKESLLNQRVGRIFPLGESIDNSFLWYLLSQPEAQLFWGNLAGGSANQANISPDIIKSFEFLLPPLTLQRQIADFFNTIDEKINLLFKQKFIVHRKDEWKLHSVGDVVSIRGGTTPSTSESKYWNGQHHWTSPRDLSNSSSPFLTTTEKTITDVGLKQIGSGLLPIGTVLLSSRAPIGYLAISDLPVAINQGYIAIVCDKVVSKYFMYFWLKSNMNTIISAANGSTFLEISKSTFKSLDFVLPESSCLIDFDKQVYPLFERVRKNVYEINTLKKLRDKLLPKLMSGSISV